MSRSNALPFRREPPPIADRPQCLHCGKTLRPTIDTIKERVEKVERVPHYTGASTEWRDAVQVYHQEVAREWDGGYNGRADMFCSTKCAAEFGIAIGRLFVDGKTPGLTEIAAARIGRLRAAREIARGTALSRSSTRRPHSLPRPCPTSARGAKGS